MLFSIGWSVSLFILESIVSARGQYGAGDCFMPPFICMAIPRGELMWAYPEWKLVGSYHDMIYAYGHAMDVLNKIKDGGSTLSAGPNQPNVTTWKISNWPEKLEPKYLFLVRDAKRLEVIDGELEDITGPFEQQSGPQEGVVLSSDGGAFPALRRVPEAEVLSFSHNKIKQIKADTFKYNPKLREIYLDHNEIATVSPDAFSHLRNLEKLVFHNNKLTRVPHGLPPSLSYLDLMNNLCGQTASVEVIIPEKLSYLNLCGNYLQNSTIFRRVSFSNINTLCIGDKGPQLPFNLVKNSTARLQNLTLSAKRNEYAELLDRTAKDLKKLAALVELNIDYYRLKNVDFILPLDKLEILRLHNVALPKGLKPDTVRMMLQNKKNLKVLSLDGSPDLVDVMRPFFLCLPNLESISLQQTGLVTLKPENFADNVIHSLRLDISYNPLECNDDLDWIHSAMTNTSTNFTLLASNSTYCSLPHLIKLTEFQMRSAQKTVNEPRTPLLPPPELSLRAKYYKNIVTAGDIIVACLTIVPAIIIIVYLLGTCHRRRPTELTEDLVG